MAQARVSAHALTFFSMSDSARAIIERMYEDAASRLESEPVDRQPFTLPTSWPT